MRFMPMSLGEGQSFRKFFRKFASPEIFGFRKFPRKFASLETVFLETVFSVFSLETSLGPRLLCEPAAGSSSPAARHMADS
jgi:hypothetical protein